MHLPPPHLTLTSTGHAPQPSVAVLQQTRAYTSIRFQAVTSPTIAPSSHGEEALEHGDTSPRWVQAEEVFTRLPTSPFTPARHPCIPISMDWRITTTLWSHRDHNQLYISVCTADPTGNAHPVCYGQDSALFF